MDLDHLVEVVFFRLLYCATLPFLYSTLGKEATVQPIIKEGVLMFYIPP